MGYIPKLKSKSQTHNLCIVRFALHPLASGLHDCKVNKT